MMGRQYGGGVCRIAYVFRKLRAGAFTVRLQRATLAARVTHRVEPQGPGEGVHEMQTRVTVLVLGDWRAGV
jgi:hypothetical protein